MYETQANRDDELRIAQAFLKHYDSLGLTLVKLPISYSLDWAAVDEKGCVHMYIEVKKRNIPSNMYATTILSVQKANCLLVKSSEPCFLVVEWTDRTGYINFSEFNLLSHHIINRTDRNDPNDICPHVKIPIDWFEFI